MALLRAACRRGVRGPGEGSQALALCHWRRTFTPPGELKRGGIINKSALTGLRVKGAATGPLHKHLPWGSRVCGVGENTPQQREAALYSQLNKKPPSENYQALSKMIQAAQRPRQAALVSFSVTVTCISCPGRGT